MNHLLLLLFLFISFLLNGFLAWYAYNILQRLLTVSENLDFLVVIIKSYRSHLKSVYEMEMFYGDQTLESLIKHTKELSQDLERYEEVYSLTSLPENEEENKDDYDHSEEEVDSEEKTTRVGKTILHQGA